jgi:hypothetical protein
MFIVDKILNYLDMNLNYKQLYKYITILRS